MTDGPHSEDAAFFESVDSLLAAISVPVAAIDDEGVVRCWNRAAEMFFNVLRNNAEGRRLSEMVVIRDEHLHFRDILTELRDKRQWSGVASLFLPGRDNVPVQWTCRELRFNPDHPVLFVVEFLEISEHKKIEQALRASEERFRSIAEQSRDCIMRFDRRHRHLYVNQVVEEQTGLPPREYIGKTHRELGFPEDMCAFWGKALDRVFKKNQPHRIEFDLPTGFSIDWQLTPERNEKGEVESVITYARDITARKKIERALKESETQFRTMVEGQGEGIGVVDDEERFLYANPAAHKIFGVMPGTLVGRNLLEFLDDTEASNIRRQTSLRLQGGESTYQVEIIRPDRQHRILLVTAVPRIAPDGSFSGSLGVFRDITSIIRETDDLRTAKGLLEERVAVRNEELLTANHQLKEEIEQRKRIEEALRESEEKFRNLSEKIMDGVAVNINGKNVWVNKAFGEMLGYETEELIGVGPEKGIVEEELPRVLEYLQKRLRGELSESLRYQTRARKKDGSIIAMEVSTTPVTFEKKPAIMVVCRDITAQKKAEERLLASEEKFRSLFELSRDGVIVASADTDEILDINNEACRLMHCRPEAIQGKPLACIFPPDRGEYFISLLQQHLRTGDFIGEDFEVITSIGERIPVDVVGSTYILQGRPVAHVVIRDVSQRRAMERELKETSKQIALYNDILTHDINNINQTMLSYINLLYGEDYGELNEAQKSFIVTSKKQIYRVTNLIDKIRTLSYLRREPEEAKQNMDLYHILRQIIDDVRGSFADYSGSIRFEGEEGRHIRADRLIHQLFYNLLENAVKHTMDETEIRVLLEETADNGNGFWRVAIEDSGPGISDEVKQVIFNRFEATGKRRGSGLGLAIVKALAERFGGQVGVIDRVTGDPSQGARFEVLLPKSGN